MMGFLTPGVVIAASMKGAGVWSPVLSFYFLLLIKYTY